MVRNFKGVVKVEDVQAEFDALLTAINAKIDTYNNALDMGEDIDYNNGSPDLAAYGYTLSIGGLKKVLEAYNGAILGAKVLKVSSGQYVVSEGLYIKDDSVTRLPSKVVNGEGTVVYYHTATNEYDFSERRDDNLLVMYGCQIEDGNIVPNYIAPSGGTINEEQSLTPSETGYYVPAGQESSESKLDYSYVLMPFYDKYIYTFPCSSEGSLKWHDVLLGFFDNNGHWQTVIEIPLFFDTTYAPNFGTAYYYQSTGYSAVWDDTNLRYNMTSSASGAFGYGGRGIISNYANEFENIPIGKAAFQVGRWGTDIQLGTWKGMRRLQNLFGYRYTLQYTPNLSQEDYNRITHVAIIPNAGMITQDYPWKLDYFGMYDTSDPSYDYSDFETFNNFLGTAENELYVEIPNDGIRISAVNKNRISRLCNRPNATNEEIPDYKVTIESKNTGYVINGNESLSNSEKGQFYSGSAGRNCRINLFDTQVAYHQWHGDRNDSYWEPFNFMFIPKGISNPYNGLAGETRFAMQKVWNYILKRPDN